MKIAILGLGKIGGGVYELVKARRDMQVKRALDVRAWAEDMTTDIDDIASDGDIDAVVEAMGGVEPAREYALKCIRSGKHFITANKHMMSECALELQKEAELAGVSVLFGAACGGGIAYLSNLKDAAGADDILSVGGILNGTTNYILDCIQSEDMDYLGALSRAQDLGYAERDPQSDVDGLDAQRKLALACAVAFGRLPRAKDIPTFGISSITRRDIEYFQDKNLQVRLIARAEPSGEGVSACVQPQLFGPGAPELAIRKNVNYAWYSGARGGLFAFSGQGAGRYPTAANIIRDILHIGESTLPAGARAAEVLAGDACAYYARAPITMAAGLRGLMNVCREEGEWLIGETMPLANKDMHALMAGARGAFFAAM